MRRVYAQPKSRDRSDAEKNLRKWFDRNAGDFQKRMLELEEKDRQAPAVAGAAAGLAPDPGSARVREVIHRLYAQFVEEGKK